MSTEILGHDQMLSLQRSCKSIGLEVCTQCYDTHDIPFQHEHVHAELQEYALQEPAPNDALTVLETVKYLQACHEIFERGILGKKVLIKSMDNLILRNMDSVRLSVLFTVAG